MAGLLSIGARAVTANYLALNTVSHNIANANTAGFKTSRAEFADVVSKSLKGVLGGNQIGGARLVKGELGVGVDIAADCCNIGQKSGIKRSVKGRVGRRHREHPG